MQNKTIPELVSHLKVEKKLKKKKGKVMIFSQQKYQPGLKVEVEASEVL